MTSALKTSSPDKAVPEHDLDADSLSAIRSILTEEEAPAPRRARGRAASPEAQTPRDVAPLRTKASAFPQLTTAEPDPTAADVSPKPAKRGFSLRRKQAPSEPAPRPAAAASRPVSEDMTGETGRGIKGYRPKPAHIVLALLGLLVLFRPWLVLGLTLLFAFILVGVFLIVGYDGFWKSVMKAGRWYAARRPERAAKLNKRLDSFAMKWDAILDRFPEGSVDGLYLPDFGELAVADKRHEEAMDRRLSGLAEKAS